MPGWNAGATSGNPLTTGQPNRGASYKVHEVQQRVDAVKGIMQENVEVMLANIDKTEVLENKSAALADQAKTFHKTARATRKHMCRQNAKMNLIICCVCVLLLTVILVPTLMHFIPMSGNPASPSPSPPSPSPPPSASPSPLPPPS